MPIQAGSRPFDGHASPVIQTSLGCGFKVVPELAGYSAVSGNLSPSLRPPHRVDTGPHSATGTRDGCEQQDLADLGVGNAVARSFL